jgi:ubiquinone/menaquinone biosynthesis C-methylase UbiE
LVLSAGSDVVVSSKAQKEFFDKISSVKKEFVDLPGFKHALFHEKDREQVSAPARKFIEECFESKKKNLPMIIPQPRKYSMESFQVLLERPSKPKEILYYFLRKLLETLGPLSDGMKVGLTHGFDSGISLDYIYRNEPHGKFLIGTLIDWAYLNSTGWKGIRHRKAHLKTVLRKTIETLAARGEKAVILDCAAGCGRYLFETIAEVNPSIEVHLRDINEYNLETAKKTAGQLDVRNATFSKVDAFNPASYTSDGPKPNIVIISGLFELYSDNELLNATLSNVRRIMQEGGYILYTGQPWHPQLEVIARVLNNHQGRRWVMRTRVQAELDELVTYAGFYKLDTVIDDLGIFTVSIAQNINK